MFTVTVRGPDDFTVEPANEEVSRVVRENINILTTFPVVIHVDDSGYVWAEPSTQTTFAKQLVPGLSRVLHMAMSTTLAALVPFKRLDPDGATAERQREAEAKG